MRLAILIPSEAFLAAAGMRIRYGRLTGHVTRPGVEIEIRPVGEVIRSASFDCDVYIFAKIFDARAPALAHRLRAAGKCVGQDVFDDYFSQRGDARLARFRDGMAAMAPLTDFAICSTGPMARVLGEALPEVPVTVVGDPVESFAPLDVADAAETKVARARASRRLRLLWFGMGDNPYFPVGLADLVAFAGEIARLRRAGYEPDLTVLTNPRALTPEALAALRTLPVPARIEEWSEMGEEAALHDADVAFLPVNGQGFSIAKSLNRAISALNRGCQVLTPGHPLYADLDGFVYRRAEDLTADLDTGRCRLGRAGLAAFCARIFALADPYALGERFIDAAIGAAARPRPAPAGADADVAVVEGFETGAEIRRDVAALGALVVTSPFLRSRSDAPVRIERQADGSLAVLLAAAAAERLPDGLRARAGEAGDGRLRLEAADCGLAGLFLGDDSLATQVALYPKVMTAIAGFCREALGCGAVVIAESWAGAPSLRLRGTATPGGGRGFPLAAAGAGEAA